MPSNCSRKMTSFAPFLTLYLHLQDLDAFFPNFQNSVPLCVRQKYFIMHSKRKFSPHPSLSTGRIIMPAAAYCDAAAAALEHLLGKSTDLSKSQGMAACAMLERGSLPSPLILPSPASTQRSSGLRCAFLYCFVHITQSHPHISCHLFRKRGQRDLWEP